VKRFTHSFILLEHRNFLGEDEHIGPIIISISNVKEDEKGYPTIVRTKQVKKMKFSFFF
jgi:hypothetical protein